MLWDGNKPRPSKHSQAPLTAECFSGGWTRLLSKQSADRLINRGVCRGVCRSIFSHPAYTRSFHSHGLLWADPVTVWVCHFIKTVPLSECLFMKNLSELLQTCCFNVEGAHFDSRGNQVHRPYYSIAEFGVRRPGRDSNNLDHIVNMQFCVSLYKCTWDS